MRFFLIRGVINIIGRLFVFFEGLVGVILGGVRRSREESFSGSLLVKIIFLVRYYDIVVRVRG